MDAVETPHPTDQTLRAYGLGKLDDASAEAVDSHLEGCEPCRRRTAEVSSDTFLGRLRDVRIPAGPPSTVGRDAPQSQIGSVATAPAEALPAELANHPDFEVVRELGRGGMGVVYLIRNRLMGRQEVLKVMARHLVERPEVSERFLREIRAVASLDHPNIVSAHHAFHVGDTIAFTMAFVDGYDLSKMVKARGPLPVGHACLFIQQVAMGLQYAHEEGMVHRDIKPGNLMVSRRGSKATVKILDFGLAKAAREGAFDSALTHAGQMLGTPDFIAPEQSLNARTADIRADIYSLGCTLYYLLSGGPPFRAESLYDLLQAHHSMDAAPLNLVRPEVPTELAALVAKMMAKAPSRGFQTPAEVASALVPFYKKGGIVVGSSATDVSRFSLDTGSSPAIDPALSHAFSKKVDDGPRPEDRWASLIDARDTEPSSAPIEPVASTSPPRRWLWPAAAVAVLLLSSAAALMLGDFKVKTKYGAIVLKDLPPGVETLVDGEVVTITPVKGGEPLKVTTEPGDHELGASRGKHRLVIRKGNTTLRSQDVTVLAGGEPIRIQLEEMASSGGSDNSRSRPESDKKADGMDRSNPADRIEEEPLVAVPPGQHVVPVASGAGAARPESRFRPGATWVGTWIFDSPTLQGEEWPYVFTVTSRSGDRFKATATTLNLAQAEMHYTHNGNIHNEFVDATSEGSTGSKISFNGNINERKLSFKFNGMGVKGNPLFGHGTLIYQGPIEPSPYPDSDRADGRTAMPEEGAERLGLIGHWEVARETEGMKGWIELLANGTTRGSSRTGQARGVWILDGDRLILRWPNATISDQAWIDELVLSNDRRKFAGSNQEGRSMKGSLAGSVSYSMPVIEHVSDTKAR